MWKFVRSIWGRQVRYESNNVITRTKANTALRMVFCKQENKLPYNIPLGKRMKKGKWDKYI